MKYSSILYLCSLLVGGILSVEAAAAVDTGNDLFNSSRILLQKEGREGGGRGFGKGTKMAQKRKANRMRQFLDVMMQETVPVDFKPISWSTQHNPSTYDTCPSQ